jgi:hypothetical protein
MMVEAIRLSLAAEEERVRKASKGARKEGKKIAKEAKKEAKAADKAARKNSAPSASTSSSSLYPVGSNDSYASSSTSTAMARSTSNLGQQQASIAEVSEEMEGKGKAPAQDFAGHKPVQESTSTLNMEIRDNAGARHLEESRANLTGNQTQNQPQVRPVSPNPPVLPLPTPLQNLAPATSTSSGASSLTDRDDSAGHTPGLVAEPDSGTDTPPAEPNFNFRSLAAMIGEEDEIEGRPSTKSDNNDEHIEHAALPVSQTTTAATTTTLTPGRGRGDSGESSSSAPPPNYLSTTSIPDAKLDSEDDDDAIRPVPIEAVPNSNNASIEAKGALDVGVNERRWEATQWKECVDWKSVPMGLLREGLDRVGYTSLALLLFFNFERGGGGAKCKTIFTKDACPFDPNQSQIFFIGLHSNEKSLGDVLRAIYLTFFFFFYFLTRLIVYTQIAKHAWKKDWKK